MAETLAQFEELIQMEDILADEIQPLIKTDDEGSNNSAAATATSEKAGADLHAEFCSFKQQTQEKFEEQAKAIRDLEQLIQDSDKKQQYQANELASKTLEVLKKFNETQAKMSRSVEQLRTGQERHGKYWIKFQLSKVS